MNIEWNLKIVLLAVCCYDFDLVDDNMGSNHIAIH